MSDFLRKINKNVLSNSRRDMYNGTKVMATVLESNQKDNTCEVEYIDLTGSKQSRKGVPVRRYSESNISWFPEKGDQVIMESMGKTFEIVSQSPLTYHTKGKPHAKYKMDILTDFYGDGIGGNIF